MKAVIFDIDNCISDDGWRIPLINWHAPDPDKRYEHYHAAARHDTPGNVQLVLQHVFVLGHAPVFLTARPLAHRASTLRWLRRNFDVPRASILIMRNPGDHRPSVDLKRRMVAVLPEYGVERHDIVGAFDDRPDIVEMYRRIGLSAEVVRIHNICAYTRPEKKL